MPDYKIENMDVIEWANKYDGPKFHALLCDPPYHLTSVVKRFSKGEPEHTKTYQDMANRSTPIARLARGFCGQEWDGGDIAFKPETWAALGQHLYPGAFIMAFAGTRGYHRMAVAMEDAGLIIHPAIGYLFGTGFPKSTRIDTQLDKAAGNVRPDKLNGGHIGMGKYAGDADNDNELENQVPHVVGKGNLTNGTPIDPLAKVWASHRYGLQCLKPAFEFIAVAQVPYSGRPIDNITKTGAGALNIDGARVGGEALEYKSRGAGSMTAANYDSGIRPYKNGLPSQDEPRQAVSGRWPSNLLLHHNPDCQPGHCSESCPVERLGEMSGESVSSGGGGVKEFSKSSAWKEGEGSGFKTRLLPDDVGVGDSGTAARYFFQATWSHEILEQLMNADPVYYTAKASRTERQAGLDKPNNHPTVKSLSLTSYLAKLLAPPEAYAPRRILVPFAGTGSEMIGAVLAGWEEVTGIEQSPAYCDIARVRLAWWSQWPGWGQTDVEKILQAANDKETEAGQISLFDLLEAA